MAKERETEKKGIVKMYGMVLNVKEKMIKSTEKRPWSDDM